MENYYRGKDVGGEGSSRRQRCEESCFTSRCESVPHAVPQWHDGARLTKRVDEYKHIVNPCIHITIIIIIIIIRNEFYVLYVKSYERSITEL